MTAVTALNATHFALEVDAGLLTVTIDRRTRANALSRAVLEELDQLVATVGRDPDINSLVIVGDGDRAFSAGADISGLQSLDSRQGLNLSIHGQGVFDAFEKLPVPTIAAINGVAFGGGLELALACDIRIASTTARFAFPEITLANVPGWGGTQRLPRIIGAGRAKHMMLTGEPIDSQQALSWGLISETVTPADLHDRARVLARSLGQHSLRAVSGIKSAIQAGLEGGHSAGQLAEAAAVAVCSGTPEQVEAVTRFLTKQRPATTPA